MYKLGFAAIGGMAVSCLAVAALPASAAGEGQRRSSAPAPSLCQAGEQALFQCRAGSKSVALCAGTSGGEHYVQYRYGRPGNVELAYPAGARQACRWRIFPIRAAARRR